MIVVRAVDAWRHADTDGRILAVFIAALCAIAAVVVVMLVGHLMFGWLDEPTIADLCREPGAVELERDGRTIDCSVYQGGDR